MIKQVCYLLVAGEKRKVERCAAEGSGGVLGEEGEGGLEKDGGGGEKRKGEWSWVWVSLSRCSVG